MLTLGSRCPNGHLLTTATLVAGPACRICLGQAGGYYARPQTGPLPEPEPPEPPGFKFEPPELPRRPRRIKYRPAKRIRRWRPCL